MSKYTTGEMAKLCGVTVRTVQYYDTRGILVPSELTEGGRRLYSEEDVKRMKIICFLRDLGLSIDSISQLLSEKDPGSVIALLLDEQEKTLKKEVDERKERLKKIVDLKTGLKSIDNISVESIGDIAYIMTNKMELQRVHRTMLLTGIPLSVLQWSAIVLWITKGIWWVFLVWVIVAIPYGILASRWYIRKVAYICPQCHTVFQPSLKEAIFADHTPATRKLTCPSCKHHGFCVEVAADREETKSGTVKGASESTNGSGVSKQEVKEHA
ncbi:MAG: MerR family transcriptional regulator [Lachnospiraceae bacterium]|nr:MerR family transcriptional regulator [Lachnospiraceae bacterium]